MANKNPKIEHLTPIKKGVVGKDHPRYIDDASKKRTELIGFKVTKSEKEELEKRKDNSGFKKVSDYIREEINL